MSYSPPLMLVRRFARYCLVIWGETVQARLPEPQRAEVRIGSGEFHTEVIRVRRPRAVLPVGGSMFPAMASREFRPADDPHPAEFAYLQVELTLGDFLEIARGCPGFEQMSEDSEPHRSFAFHRYVMGRACDAFRQGAQLDRELVDDLTEAIGDVYGGTIPEAAVREMRVRMMRWRREDKGASEERRKLVA